MKKPHKTEYWCGKSTDPEFEQKLIDNVGLYLSPPKNALVLCVDEKTQIQALDRRQPELPLRTGNPKRLTTTYKRHGTVSLIAALAVHAGDITAKTIDKNDYKNFLAFLKKTIPNVPKPAAAYHCRQLVSTQKSKSYRMGRQEKAPDATFYTNIFILAKPD